MKFGDLIRGAVNGFDDKGRGRIPPRSVIPFTAPGDDVEAVFIKRDKGVRIGKLTKIVAPSPDRVAAPCPHAGTCGGCLWQHLAYDAQLKTKGDMINRAFERANHDERITDVLPSPEQFYYRNRMDYVVGWKGEVGLKEYGSWNRYLDLTTCLLLDQDTPRILQTVRELTRDLNMEPWDAKKYTGQLRYVVIRSGKNTGERMITLIVKDARPLLTKEGRPDASRVGEVVRRLAPLCTTLYLGENPEITDLSIAKTLVLLHGNECLTEEVNGLRYLIHPNSFFQTNTAMAARLQNVVLDSLPMTRYSLLDLYCGLGFFGIACARRGATVHGFELDADAIELAKRNAEFNGVAERASFVPGSVESMVATIGALPPPDAVIVDPPRAGLHPRALQLLLDLKAPTLLYISCNFHRLVEELKQLKTLYRVADVKALDLFPHTPHVEVVVKLVLYS